MRLTRKSIGKLTMRTAGLFLLGMFLQWMGMPTVTTQPGTVYAQIAQAIGAGPPQDSVAKLPPQQ